MLRRYLQSYKTNLTIECNGQEGKNCEKIMEKQTYLLFDKTKLLYGMGKMP